MKWFTTRELADILGTVEWRIRRLFEDGTLAEPARFGGKRAICSHEIPQIVDGLRARGWILGDHNACTSNLRADVEPSARKAGAE